MKKIAIPTENGKLCAHFGHCQQFAIIHVEEGQPVHESYVTPPPHEPGLLPSWLGQMGVTNIIAGGMGQKAIQLFKQQNIEVTLGAQEKSPGNLVQDWLANSLVSGSNTCDH